MLGHTYLQLPNDIHVAAAPLAGGGGGGGGAWLVNLLPFIVIIAVFYLILIRPQRNQRRRLQEMRSNLAVGQNILTTAGLYATITEVEDNSVVLEVAPDVECRYAKESIMQVIDNPGSDEDEDPDVEDAADDPDESVDTAETDATDAEDTDIADADSEKDESPAPARSGGNRKRRYTK